MDDADNDSDPNESGGDKRRFTASRVSLNEAGLFSASIILKNKGTVDLKKAAVPFAVLFWAASFWFLTKTQYGDMRKGITTT